MRLRRIPPLEPAEACLPALLRATATADGDPAPPCRLPADAGPQLWRRLLERAEEHRVLERLFSRRARGGWWERCPDSARAVLRHHYLQTALRNDHLYGELARAVAALRDRGITPVLLKGAALTATVLEDPAARPCSDVDLLVSPAELDEAAAALLGCGFRLDERFRPEAFYRAHHYHLVFRHPQRPWVCLELHWDLTLPMLDTRLDTAAVRERALPAQLAGEPVRVPEPGDLLLHLVLHTGMNGFAFLGQVCDAADVLDRQGGAIHAPTLWARARAWRLESPLRAVLALLPLCAPETVGSGLRAAAPRGRLEPALRALLRPEFVLRQRLRDSGAGAQAAAILRRDKAGARWRCLGRRLRPSAVDLAMEGHEPASVERPPIRHFLDGLSLASRAAVFTLLTTAGWEVVRKPGSGPRAEPGPAGRSAGTHLS